MDYPRDDSGRGPGFPDRIVVGKPGHWFEFGFGIRPGDPDGVRMVSQIANQELA